MLFRRSINQMLIRQRLLKTVAQHEKIIRKAADTLNMPEEKVVEIVKGLKHRHFFNSTETLNTILNAIANDGNTRDILTDYEKLQKYEGRFTPFRKS